MIKSRVLRTGDGSHKYSKLASTDVEMAANDNNNITNERDTEHFWGWGRLKIYFCKSTILSFCVNFRRQRDDGGRLEER